MVLFRYRVTWGLYVACAAVIAAHAAGVLPLWRHITHAHRLLDGIGFALALAGYLTYDLVRARRGGVCADDRGVTLLDWRGRARTLPWKEISECHWHTGPLGWWFRFPVEVRGGQSAALQVLKRVADEPALVQTVAERAGLTHRQRKWWGTLYTRPGPS
jgi:hypothetical protein